MNGHVLKRRAFRASAVAALATAVVVAAISPGRAEIAINMTERTYDVFGASVEELRAQMKARGPFSEKSEGHVPAQTRSTVGFTFTVRQAGGRCHLRRIKVTADVNYLFPNWADPAGADRALAEKWFAYREALQIHEEKHGEMVVAAARDVERALQAVGPMGNCRTLRTRARKAGEAILRTMAAAQIAYDEETGGGKTQGAVFRADGEEADEDAPGDEEVGSADESPVD